MVAVAENNGVRFAWYRPSLASVARTSNTVRQSGASHFSWSTSIRSMRLSGMSQMNATPT
jgi:hypothetical protein